MFKKMSGIEKVVFIFSYILFTGLGLLFFVPGVINSKKCDVKTTAVVVNVDSYEYTDIETHSREIVYRPTISYEVNGISYESPYGDYTNVGVLHEGERVDIRYDSEHPSVYVLDRWYGLELKNFLGLFIIVFMILFIFKINSEMKKRY